MTLFDEMRLAHWPALLLLRAGRENEPLASLSARVLAWFGATRVLADEDSWDAPPDPPASADDVCRWLWAVWQRLITARESELPSRRRAMAQAIAESPLSEGDQARYLTSVDYLSSLSTAARSARAAVGGPPPEIPPTRSPLMQAACRKLAGLAATDLPIWLSGEKGTELDWAAAIVLRLRGIEDDAVRVWETVNGSSAHIRESWEDLTSTVRAAGDVTVLARHADEAPEEVQRVLHDRLVKELSGKPSFGIVVTSGPVDLAQGHSSHADLELFAFLSPMRLEIPPLRRRMEDLESLISFFARSRGLPDPTDRFSPEAMEALRNHHWPGNTEELAVTVAYALEKRPAGRVRIEDLPDTIRVQSEEEREIMTELEEIHKEQGFRMLATDVQRRAVANFLIDPRRDTFRLLDVQKTFGLAKETARRLLTALIDRRVITGIKGAKGDRITSYCFCKRTPVGD
jgi:transcriptional regulator of acetoin/glycerol metabolism